jgi:hypothetical protein
MLQILGVLEYACGHPPLKNQSDGKSRSAGLQPDRALIVIQNPISEIASAASCRKKTLLRKQQTIFGEFDAGRINYCQV